MAGVRFSLFYGSVLYPSLGAWLEFTDGTSAEAIREHQAEVIAHVIEQGKNTWEDIPDEFAWQDSSDDGRHGADFIAWARDSDLDTLCDILGVLSKVEEVESTQIMDLCGALYNNDYARMRDAVAYHDEHFNGIYDDLAHFAESEVKAGAEIPDYVSQYVDWATMGDNMQYDYIIVPLEKKIAVYSN